MTNISQPPAYGKLRSVGACSAILLVAMSFTIGGFYLPWFSFHINDTAKHLSPADVGIDVNLILNLWIRPISFSPIAAELLTVFFLFGVASMMILKPDLLRLSVKKVWWASIRLGIVLWCGYLIIVNISLFELMWLALGFDNSDTNATNFYYDIGVLCTFISLVMSISAAFFAVRIRDPMTPRIRQTSNRQVI